jgi:hypothetical protein
MFRREKRAICMCLEAALWSQEDVAVLNAVERSVNDMSVEWSSGDHTHPQWGYLC